MDLEAVNYIDASGSIMLVRLIDRIKSMNIEPALANISCSLLDNDKHMRVDFVFESKGRSIVELFKKLDHEYLNAGL